MSEPKLVLKRLAGLHSFVVEAGRWRRRPDFEATVVEVSELAAHDEWRRGLRERVTRGAG